MIGLPAGWKLNQEGKQLMQWPRVEEEIQDLWGRLQGYRGAPLLVGWLVGWRTRLIFSMNAEGLLAAYLTGAERQFALWLWGFNPMLL